jgi:hypothetical protein
VSLLHVVLARLLFLVANHHCRTWHATYRYAEPEIHLSATRSATGYTGDAIVDPSHLLVKELKRRGLLDVAITERKGYEYGVAQPAVLVIKKDGTALESWAIVPKMVCLFSHLPSLRYSLWLF